MAAAAIRTSYSIPQKSIHWLMALLIFFNLIFSENIETWDHAMDKGTVTPDVVAAANIHAYAGIAVLALALLRVILRSTQGAPHAPEAEPVIFRQAAKVAHAMLYVLFFLMPISGMMKYYGGIDFAGFVHAGPMKLLLWILVVGHILAIPVHHFVWKTDVALRMTRG
jgi:cytochrome b561